VNAVLTFSTGYRLLDRPIHRTRLELAAVVVLASAFFLWFALPLWQSASATSRQVATFSCDELVHLQKVRGAVEDGTFRIHYPSYGYLYFNLALTVLLALKPFVAVSDHTIILVLRIIPTLFAVGTVAVAFAMARRHFGRVAGGLAALLMALSCREFLEWSVVSHPDVVQDFFFLLGAAFLCRFAEAGGRKWLLWASAAAGLAFATKYGGVFLLPVLWAVCVAHAFGMRPPEGEEPAPEAFAGLARRLAHVAAGLCAVGGVVALLAKEDRSKNLGIWLGLAVLLLAASKLVGRWTESRPRLAGAAGRVLLSLLVFLLAFFVASPYSFSGWEFVDGIQIGSEKLSFGHGFREAGGGLEWFSLLLSESGLSPLLAVLALLCLVRVGLDARREGWRRLLRADGVLWAVVLFFVAYLVVRVQQRRLRFILMAVPPLIVLSTAVVGYVLRRWAGRRGVVGAGIVVAAVCAAVVPTSVRRLVAFRSDMAARETTSVRMQAGRWMAEHFAAGTTVLADHYAYVPVELDLLAFTHGGRLSYLRSKDPDVVVVTDKVASRFSDPDRAEDFGDGPDRYLEIHAYYRALADGTAGYERVRDFGEGEVRVYRRKPASAGG